jgi:hypothetical protein
MLGVKPTQTFLDIAAIDHLVSTINSIVKTPRHGDSNGDSNACYYRHACGEPCCGCCCMVAARTLVLTRAAMRHRKQHPITSDMTRELSVAALAKAGGFKGPGLRFPFQHLETKPDHIRVFRVGDKSRQSPQIVAVTWRKMTFGMKPFFICPRCNTRRVFLYFDGLQAYCRCCADLWYWCQRKHHRTRLLHRSRKLRLTLGDQTGKPGSPFPPRPYRQKRTRYRRTIAALRTIEQQYMHIIASDRRYLDRDRDEYGRYLPNEVSADDANTEDLGEER